MAKWMVSNGAKTIVLVSRTGSATGKVKDLIDESATVGASIVVAQCDVANKASVEKLINNGLTGFPQVRGVVHGAMVLNVSFIVGWRLKRKKLIFDRMFCLRKWSMSSIPRSLNLKSTVLGTSTMH